MNKIGDKASESKCALVFGQMNEPPGARARVALTGLTIAEYFRDYEGQDVLLFIDNIFRFTQARRAFSPVARYWRLHELWGAGRAAGRAGRPCCCCRAACAAPRLACRM